MAETTHDRTGWTNWSGNQSNSAAKLIQPRNEDELREIVINSAGPIRVAGSGHSFTPIVSTNGTIINLDHMGGVISTDPANLRATVRAGGRLRDLSPELEKSGLAFRNLGDINVQSFAGASATGTHGTGQEFGSISSEITAIRIMTANGDIVEGSVDNNPELIKAAQVSVGALGVIIEATVNLCPSYNLHRRTWVEPIGSILESIEEKWHSNRNYEFFYIPFSGFGINIQHNTTDEDETERPPSEDEEALAAIRAIRDKTKWSKFLRRKLLSTGLKRSKGEDVIGPSWKLLASPRETRFNEMEYHLPPNTALDALSEVITYIEKYRSDVFFPIEVRKTAGDEAWLSPFQGGARVSIAVHAAGDEDHSWFFEGVEPIFRSAGGRPHWGKLHSLEYDDLKELYPDFSKFLSLRKKMDPAGRFMTPSLAKLWGEV